MIRLILFLPIVLSLLSYSTLKACTIFTASDEKSVLVGNNEDSSPSLKTFLWYYPSQRSKHGYVTWGSKSQYPEGGMNDKGLFWDAAALMQAIPSIRDPKKPDFKAYFVDKALAECATVTEVIQLVQLYNLVWQERAQILVADATGDYALIHSNYIIRKSDLQKPYVAVANFSLQNYHYGGSTCYRFNAASNMLQQYPISFSLFRNILAKAAQKDPENATIYSQIADLKARKFYLYQRHNFDQVAIINLADELKKGRHQVEIKSLFPLSIREQLAPIILQKGIKSALAQYHEWQEQAPTRYNFRESELDELGYELLNMQKVKEAIQIFTLNQTNYPASDQALSSLASAYLIQGDTAKARSIYLKALKINPASYVSNLFGNQSNGVITFRFKELEYAGKICLVGSFNNWSTTANPFIKNAQGEWVCQLKLQPGIYRYTFLVGEDNWMIDPLNKLAQKPDKYWQSTLIVQ